MILLGLALMMFIVGDASYISQRIFHGRPPHGFFQVVDIGGGMAQDRQRGHFRHVPL